MSLREIGLAIDRCAALSMKLHMIGDARIQKALGLAVARRGGLLCLSSTEVPGALFNRALGFGTVVRPTQRAVDVALRHYASLGLPARFEILDPVVGPAAVGLLERNGFRREDGEYQVHVLEPRRPPSIRDVAGLRVERVPRARAAWYAHLASEGFDSKGRIGRVFERGWVRQLTAGRYAVAFVGRVGRSPASTGVVVMTDEVAGLYSGSVMRRFRGRGFQNAMIRARVAYAYARGRKLIYAMTEPESASARNLRDEGFRTRFEARRYVRDAI
jgi:GNAT superfamily N-acetyltransferase